MPLPSYFKPMSEEQKNVSLILILLMCGLTEAGQEMYGIENGIRFAIFAVVITDLTSSHINISKFPNNNFLIDFANVKMALRNVTLYLSWSKPRLIDDEETNSFLLSKILPYVAKSLSQ